MRRAVCALTLFAVAGCSGSGSHGPAQVANGGTDPTIPPGYHFTPPATAGLCSQVFAPGMVVSPALTDKGCTEANGGTQLFSYQSCVDGSRFVNGENVFGFVGKIAVAGSRNSPGSTAAAGRCRGSVPLAPPPSFGATPS
jgi:hypothetical protein